MSNQDLLQLFHGPNAGYALELYEKYQQNPATVDPITRAYFEHWQPNGDTPPSSLLPPLSSPLAAPNVDKIMGAVNLAQAIREYGHLAAQLDPLGEPPPGDPALSPAYHGITDEDLRQLPASLIGGPVAHRTSTAHEAVQGLRQIYCTHLGYDYEHVREPQEREWLRETAESGQFRPPNDPIDNLALLQRLTQVETFELFLHRIFPGKTRFSIEGLDIMVPMLDEIIGDAAESGIYNIFLGMAHRGRLNVLAHILGRSYAEILTQFKDPHQEAHYNNRNNVGWTGDVKYHDGVRHARKTGKMIDLVVNMAPNPSHLEHVNPVVVGMARAAGMNTDKAGPPYFNHSYALPIIIHGDAAFSGQGIVPETLNMYRLPSYRVGGTIHIIANNQVGFTADDFAGRSTLYASDLAKGFKLPIIHVNADDPVACLEAARLSIVYRRKFQKDFIIDLIGYRRYGHNEGDEPRFTQPVMYQKIDNHPTVRQLWATHLTQNNQISSTWAEELVLQQMGKLQAEYESLKVEEIAEQLEPQLQVPPAGAAKMVETAVSAHTLQSLNQSWLTFPPGFTPHPKLARSLKRRETALDNPDEAAIDWATAETLALASILADGIPVRFTGEDVERGTFGHRHAVFHDSQNGATHVPLQTIPQARAAFEIRNSPLTENAAIGFEYGYNIQAPERLVIWEAQYGDFINTAQAIIDEFVVSGKAKWEQTPSLVLLLPHAYEGQGPDHSSARLERFLQLAAKTSVRIAYPTTAAQYFHLLRRQALLLKTDPLPLIVMSPKSLLRHPLAASTLRQLSEGQWQPVIDDPLASQHPEQIRRVVLCSGKVWVDLVAVQKQIQEATGKVEVALVRVEQLYIFPGEAVKQVLAGYANAEEVVWMQEEPVNMGAWDFVRPRIERVLEGKVPLRYIGRPRRASPAEGSTTWHTRNQKAITEHAFDFSTPVTSHKADIS